MILKILKAKISLIKFVLLSSTLYLSFSILSPIYKYKYLGSYVVKLSSGRSTGTGFMVNHNGNYYMATNKHVCGLSESLYDSTNRKTLKVLKTSLHSDLCLLENPYAKGLSLSPYLFNYAPITLIGHPAGQDLTVREGHIISSNCTLFSWISRELCTNYYTISAISYPGNSGSPILSPFGQVVGILFGGIWDMMDRSFILPSSQLILFIEYYEQHITKS